MNQQIETTDTLKEMGEAINKAIDESGKTLGEVGREIGMDRPYLARIRKGLGNPLISTLEKIAKATGTRLRIIFEKIGEK